MRNILILLAVLGIGVGAYFLLRDDGVIEQVTEAQVESALLANGLPAPMAECMAPRLTDRLSINQLRKLQRMAPQEGEGALPTSTTQALERLRRVDDDEAVEQLVRTGTTCGIELMMGGN